MLLRKMLSPRAHASKAVRIQSVIFGTGNRQRMETLFDKKTYDTITARVGALTPSTQQVWGKMNVAQMLAHCAEAIEMANGDKKLPRIFLGRILGPLVKKGFLSEAPFRKNSPTAKSLVIADEKNFEKEKQRLLDLLQRFNTGGEAHATTHPHTFFGHLTQKQWGEMQWKHMDHHLRQFGV